MKQFIVLMAVLPVMMIFFFQFTADQRHGRMVGEIQEIVYSAKEEAKQEGYFSSENRKRLKEDLGRAAGVDPEEILIDSDDRIKTRFGVGEERLIYFTVSVPIRGVMAASPVLGMSEEENSYRFVIDSYTASERI